MYQIILDIDGVLVNTDESYSRAACLSAQNFGAQARDLADVFELRSQGEFNDDYDVAMEFLRQDGIEVDRDELIEKFQTYYLGERWQEGLWDGLISQEPLLAQQPFVNWIGERPFSVFTGRPRDEAIHVLKRLGLIDKSQHLVGMHDVKKRKPDPEGLKQIISKMNYQQPLSVGDTLDDFRAAQAADINFVGILPPHPEARDMMAQVFANNKCDQVLQSINDLPECLRRMELAWNAKRS